MKILKYTGLGLVLLLAGVLVALLMIDDVEIVIPEAKARAQVEATLPLTVQKAGVTAVIDTIELNFRPDNKVDVVLGMDISGFSMSARAEGQTETSILYKDSAFYLADLDLEDLVVTPTGDTIQKVDEAKAVVSNIWSNLTKSEDDIVTSVATSAFKDRVISSLKPKAIDLANGALKNIPVYRLDDKDMKMRIAGTALKNVVFFEDQARVTISPSALAFQVLAIIFMVLISGFIAIGGILSGRFTFPG